MHKIIDLITRNIIWVLIGIIAVIIMRPGIAELNTLLMIIMVESLALALSGISAYVYTRIDFRKNLTNSILGHIFIGVHLCVGLVVLGVYIAQIPY